MSIELWEAKNVDVAARWRATYGDDAKYKELRALDRTAPDYLARCVQVIGVNGWVWVSERCAGCSVWIKRGLMVKDYDDQWLLCPACVARGAAMLEGAVVIKPGSIIKLRSENDNPVQVD